MSLDFNIATPGGDGCVSELGGRQHVLSSDERRHASSCDEFCDSSPHVARRFEGCFWEMASLSPRSVISEPRSPPALHDGKNLRDGLRPAVRRGACIESRITRKRQPSPRFSQQLARQATARASNRVGVVGLCPTEPWRGRVWAPSQGAHRQCLARRGSAADDRLYVGRRRPTAVGEKCGLVDRDRATSRLARRRSPTGSRCPRQP
jgi:hypothetical protein